jgi:hypothetical protein
VVGQSLDLLIVGLFGHLAIVAHPLAASRSAQDGAGFVAAIIAASGLRASPLALFFALATLL